LWDSPETAYAKAGDVHVAYQVLGHGPPDLVLVSAWFSHVEARWDLPGFAYYLRRLSSFSRLISFDKRGIGLSDPVPLERLPLLEEWMDDVRTVMDAAGSERAVVMGANEGSMMAALFAATYPDRVTALVLANATARPLSAHDHPWGVAPDSAAALIATVDESWGEGTTMAAVNPTIAGDRDAIQEWGRFLRLAASPAVAAAVIRMIFQLDVRAILPTIRVPTLVVSRRDALFAAEAGRTVAGLIPAARFVDVPGVDYGLAVGDVDPLIDEVEQFVTGSRPAPDADRVLATVLFTDIVESTTRAARLGDRDWRSLLDSHDELARREVHRHGGLVEHFTGDGVVATFDGPARAVRCALAVRDRVHALGLQIRAGLHTGEIARRGDDVVGIGVHIAARVMALASGDEVLVSRTVKDLVAGSGLEFHDRGSHQLKGVPEAWDLFRAER
jgi:class 3 adenylate cyclase/pimeloyl-ACP methyl ester carboxylesterase